MFRPHPYRKSIAAITLVVAFAVGCATSDVGSIEGERATAGIAAPAGVNSAGEPVTLELVDGGPATGLVITNHLGFAVYGVLGETKDSLVCTGECVDIWVPVDPRSSLIADGLDPSLYGAISRPDGIAQATYNDIPLYTWARDNAIGITGGAGVAGTWYALTERGGFVAAAS